jgi:hypothetical protein
VDGVEWKKAGRRCGQADWLKQRAND